MPDKDKVLIALGHCARESKHLEVCNGCPYRGAVAPPCRAALINDVLTLLKEQADTIDYLREQLHAPRYVHPMPPQKRNVNLERGIMEDIRND